MRTYRLRNASQAIMLQSTAQIPRYLSLDREAAMTAYDDVPLRPFHLRICIASTGGIFADGFALGIIGIALSLAAPQLRLSAVWIGLLGGASLAGLFAGSLLTGPAADHFGRRRIFAYNIIPAAVLSALQFVVGSGMQLLLLRIAIGFLLGTDYVVSKSLLTEFEPRLLRGSFILTALGPQSWRWMLLASAVPCLVISPLRITIPESPMWLCHHGPSRRRRSGYPCQIRRQHLPAGDC
jgi:putative MFS transporter